MKSLRLVRAGDTFIYKIVLVKKFKNNSGVEKLGTFNLKKKKLTLNIFRLLFWLSKKNIFISWSIDWIFFTTLHVFDYFWKYDGGLLPLLKNAKISSQEKKKVEISVEDFYKDPGYIFLKKSLADAETKFKNKKVSWKKIAQQELIYKKNKWKK